MKIENTIVYYFNETVEFDDKQISVIKFDLKHINYGWSKIQRNYNEHKRSEYGVSEVVFIFNLLITYNVKWDKSNKLYIVINDKYYTRYLVHFIDPWTAKSKKAVIDIEISFNTEAIIVTIY